MSDLQIDVIDMLERLGIEGHSASGGNEVNFSCPFHTDERPSAYMNAYNTRWFCWSCKARGRNAATFTSKVMDISYEVAVRFLQEAYGVSFAEPKGGSMAEETRARFEEKQEAPRLRAPALSWVEAFCDSLEEDIGVDGLRYMISRGFTVQEMMRWELGWDATSHRVTIPVYDLEGSLVGFKGRAIRKGHDPKYLILGDRSVTRYGFDPYEASQVVFGLHRNRDHDEIIICEGELNAIALSQMGYPRPVAIGMSYFTDEHAALIIRECRHAIVYFDLDEAGQDAIPTIKSKLEPHISVSVVPGSDKDPAKLLEEDDQIEVMRQIQDAQSTLALSNHLM